MADAGAPVVIVGAGPAGAGLALLLASRGVPVTLLERQRDFEREFRGEVMMPSGLDALAAMGVEVAKTDLPQRHPTELEVWVERRLAVRIDAAALGGRVPLLVSQPALLEHLVALCGCHPGFRFVRGGAVRELLTENGRVCGVRVDGAEGETRLAARLVVGADGRASLVRRRGGFTVREIGAPMDVLWAKLPWPEAWGERAFGRGYLAGGHLLIAARAPDGDLQLGWVILKGEYADIRSRGPAEWLGELAHHAAGDLAQHLRAHAEDSVRPFLLSAATDRVLGWARPGMLLIGDAAHTMSPVGGQGLNVALRDSVVAANHLVPALRAGADAAALDAAAAAVEPERAPEIDRIQALAAQPPKLVLARGPLPRLARSLLPWLVRFPPARRAAAKVGRIFLEGVTEVRLEV